MATKSNLPNINLPPIDLGKYANPIGEPSRLVGVLMVLVVIGFNILLTVGIGFDPNLPHLVLYFIMMLGSAIPLVQAEITRSKVTPTVKAEDAVKAAYEAGKAGEPQPTYMEAAEKAQTS